MTIHRHRLFLVAVLFGLGTAVWLGTASAQTGSFSNPAPLTIADGDSCGPSPGFLSLNPGKASIYPDPIAVSGLVGNVTKVTATIFGITQTFPKDLDVLLVGPTGQKTILMSDVGGGHPGINNVSPTFDDAAASFLPNGTAFTTGTYKPTAGTTGFAEGCAKPTNWPAPAPAGPYPVSLSVFNGTNPNGSWNLYVIDDGAGDIGSVGGGWSLTVTTATGTLTVTKQLVSNSLDPGKFNLKIDGTTHASCVGNNGTTGPVAVAAGVHTISETACVGNLGDYVTTIFCSDGSFGQGTSLSGVAVTTNGSTSCTIKNQRKLFKVG